jgi:hypothetical protein
MSQLDQQLTEMMADPACRQYAGDVMEILAAYQQQQISEGEVRYLLQEIKDVRAAQELANDERAFRMVVECCQLAAKVI